VPYRTNAFGIGGELHPLRLAGENLLVYLRREHRAIADHGDNPVHDKAGVPPRRRSNCSRIGSGQRGVDPRGAGRILRQQDWGGRERRGQQEQRLH
jgi:hypothetical protein